MSHMVVMETVALEMRLLESIIIWLLHVVMCFPSFSLVRSLIRSKERFIGQLKSIFPDAVKLLYGLERPE